jgi:hypothetical protein
MEKPTLDPDGIRWAGAWVAKRAIVGVIPLDTTPAADDGSTYSMIYLEGGHKFIVEQPSSVLLEWLRS